jgi:hypothetical protein
MQSLVSTCTSWDNFPSSARSVSSVALTQNQDFKIIPCYGPTNYKHCILPAVSFPFYGFMAMEICPWGSVFRQDDGGCGWRKSSVPGSPYYKQPGAYPLSSLALDERLLYTVIMCLSVVQERHPLICFWSILPTSMLFIKALRHEDAWEMEVQL